MQLTHAFDLPAPVGRVFEVFSQLDLLAPCFPGASVWGQDGDVYHGAVKIKFGPFPLVFEGTARVVRVDVPERRLVVKANARDRRGAAAGSATVTAVFRPAGADATRVEVSTELDLTGRPAQLGAGAVSSVSDRLKDQFVGCMSAKLAAGLSAEPSVGRDDSSTTGPAPESPAVSGSTVHRPSTPESSAPAAARPIRPDHAYTPPSQPGSTPHLQVLPDVVRVWLPVTAGAIGALAVLALLVRWWRRR